MKLGDIITFNPKKAYPENLGELTGLLKISREEAENITSDFSYQITEISRYVKAEVNQELFDAVYGAGVVKDEKEAGNKLYYECEIDGQKKYVFPLKGMGLWGGISAFISVDDDLNTIYGAYFNHESETAGLGAEIKDSQAWQEKFQGKKIYSDDGQLAIGVVKNVENPASEVDCVTGATLTSNGVSDMLREGLKQYITNLKED